MATILNKEQIDHFIVNGFVRINNAFPREIAREAVNILWNDLPCDQFNPDSWRQPVIRLGMYNQPPFIKSINNEMVYAVFNELVGEGKWIPCQSVGTFPVRFPSDIDPGDTGKHVDVSFPGDDPHNYFEWRSNLRSKGRALLMLLLFSDVTECDAPTVIFKSSHLDVARLLSNSGEWGMSFTEIAQRLEELPAREQVYACGEAGTIFLCHPHLVHSAQQHRGSSPKFMAQPPLLLKGELTIEGSLTGYSPVEEAIRIAINK